MTCSTQALVEDLMMGTLQDQGNSANLPIVWPKLKLDDPEIIQQWYQSGLAVGLAPQSC